MNKKLLILAAILAGIGLFAGGFFFSQVNAQSNLPEGKQLAIAPNCKHILKIARVMFREHVPG